MENVIAVSFEEDANAYLALTALKELDNQQQLDLAEAAVVIRNANGHLETKDQIGGVGVTGTATGGVIGLLIGILGGPFGILIGGATGLLIGSLFDIEDGDDTESVLSDISRSLRVDRASLLAEVGEQSPEVVDTAMAKLGGAVLRRSVDDVEAEIAAADEAQKKAKRAARKALREKRRDHLKEEIRAIVDAMKAKLHRHRSVGAGGG
jgi:uncharacterized membrane protein